MDKLLSIKCYINFIEIHISEWQLDKSPQVISIVESAIHQNTRDIHPIQVCFHIY